MMVTGWLVTEEYMVKKGEFKIGIFLGNLSTKSLKSRFPIFTIKWFP